VNNGAKTRGETKGHAVACNRNFGIWIVKKKKRRTLACFILSFKKIWDLILIIHGSINKWAFCKLFLYKKIILRLLFFLLFFLANIRL
jgi:hypothetical protein